MTRPYGLLRAGFPYLKTLGEFLRTTYAKDIAFGNDGRVYCLVAGNSGPITVTNLEDDDLGGFGAPDFGFRLPNHKCAQGNQDDPVRDGALLRPTQLILDRDELLLCFFR